MRQPVAAIVHRVTGQRDLIRYAQLARAQTQAGRRDHLLAAIQDHGPAHIGQAGQIGQIVLQFGLAALTQVIGQAALQQDQTLVDVVAPGTLRFIQATRQQCGDQQYAEQQGSQAQQQRQRTTQRQVGQHGASSRHWGSSASGLPGLRNRPMRSR